MDKLIYIIIGVVVLIVIIVVVLLLKKKKNNESSEPIHADFDPSIAQAVEENNMNNIPTNTVTGLDAIAVDNVIANTDNDLTNNVNIDIPEENIEPTFITDELKGHLEEENSFEMPQVSNESFMIPDEPVKFEEVKKEVKAPTFITEEMDDRIPRKVDIPKQELVIDKPDATDMTEINKQL